MPEIALETSEQRAFALPLGWQGKTGTGTAIKLTQETGLPEHIRRDDVLALREEWAVFMNAYGLGGDATYLRKAIQVEREIEICLAQAQKAGFNTEGW